MNKQAFVRGSNAVVIIKEDSVEHKAGKKKAARHGNEVTRKIEAGKEGR